MKYAVVDLLVIAACVPACAAAAPMTSQATKWTVVLELSGGFAGFDRRFELSDTGRVVAVDRSRNTRAELILREDELSRLTAAVGAAVPPSPVRGQSCRDCLNYHLEVRTGGRGFSVDLDDTTLPQSGLESLITELVELQNRAFATLPKPARM